MGPAAQGRLQRGVQYRGGGVCEGEARVQGLVVLKGRCDPRECIILQLSAPSDRGSLHVGSRPKGFPEDAVVGPPVAQGRL